MSELMGQLPERGLETALRGVEQTSREFKSAQRASSASGQMNYTIESSNAWDRTETISQGALSLMTLVVTMNTDRSQDWPEALMYMDIRANGTGNTNKFYYLTNMPNGSFYYAMYGWTDGTNVLAYAKQVRNYNKASGIFTWTIDFRYSGTITYYIKPVIRATCGGTISITRTV